MVVLVTQGRNYDPKEQLLGAGHTAILYVVLYALASYF